MARNTASRMPRWFWPAAAISVVLVVVGLALFRITADDDRETFRVAAGENQFVNQDSVSVAAHNSPAVIENPTDPDNLVVASRTDRPVRGGTVHVSGDGGATWTDVGLALPGREPGFAPEIGFDKSGKLYALFATVPPGGAIPSGLWVESSTDGGRTFAKPVRVAPSHAFHHRLAVAPDGRLYATWLQADPNTAPPQCLPCFVGTGLPIVASTSADGGVTWSRPVRVSDEGRQRVGAPTPAVGPDGSLYVLYTDFKEDKPDWENQTVPPYEGPVELVMAKSSDAGATFSPGRSIDAGVRLHERFLVFFPKYPAMAVASDGSVHIAWQDARNGDSDILYRRSPDAGQTWTGAIRVNDDKIGNGRHQYLPAIAAAVPGRVDILYYDRRDDPRNLLVGAYYATSLDAGANWKSVPASDELFDSRIGPGSERQLTDPGSRIGVLSRPAEVVAVWTDSRRGSLDSGKQDIAFARIVVAKKD